ncbi:PAS-domain containing protein [Yoonia sp. SS1-5]|uniref:histidine kinase n=1 Tax=Yoonia rhodophyticola TaxID=3137370 RepID=A0AAN0MCB0_9RHOB
MSIINPNDTLSRQNEKLLQITQSLMRRVEQKNDQSGLAYQQFERAALLETQVRERTKELERTLDLLQESNAQLEAAHTETERARANITEAIETINEGFALFDPDERLVLFNSRFCRDVADITQHLSEGLHFTDYVDLVSQSTHLALSSDETPQDWAAKRLSRHSSDHVVFNVRLMWNRWLQISEHRTARGGTVILQTDVTEMMRSERQQRDEMLDQQARILQATLDHLNQGVCIFDHNKTLVGWNKTMNGILAVAPDRAIRGLAFSALLNMLESELTFHGDFDRARLARWANHRSRRKPIAFEITRNDVQTLSVFAQEMPDRGFVISFTDVTAEREAAQALFDINETLERGVMERTEELGEALAEAERANASKSRFVAAASHDLLQPLSAAKLFMSSLSDQLTEPQTRKVLAQAETALSGVENIIEALLDISKLDAGKAVFDVRAVKLSAILGPLRDELTPVARAKGLELTVVDSSLSVISDPGYLRRILQNLIANAVKYTVTGRVIVGVRRNGGSARVEVWDTGPGIAEDDTQTIFQEFARLDGVATNDGLGLGLAIVERAAMGLGHELSLWSRPGHGSCFSINVPVATVDAASIPKPSDDPAALGDVLRGMIVLLVENDQQVAHAMSLMVENHGAEVLLAQNAAEALALLREIQLVPDVLLLDYQLGAGADGLMLYRDIQQKFGAVPAAIISADRSRELQQDCNAAGLSLLAKPIDRDKLLTFLTGTRAQPARMGGFEFPIAKLVSSPET